MKGLNRTGIKVALMGSSLLFALSSFGVGYGIWAFNDQTAEASTEVEYKADPISENVAFEDAYDYAETGARSYDVYFMAQMCDITTHILTTEGASPSTVSTRPLSAGTSGYEATESVTNYVIREDPVPYHLADGVSDAEGLQYEISADPSTSTYNDTAPQDFGMWMDSSSTEDNPVPLTDDISKDENRYFKRIASVKELSVEAVANLGTPYFNLGDRGGWALSFMTWTPCYNLPVYYTGSLRHNNYDTDTYGTLQTDSETLYPDAQNRVLRNNSTVINRRVTGYAPYSEAFTSLYAGTILEYYERLAAGGVTYTPIAPSGASAIQLEYVWYVNGRPSIFFFPTYSSDGKNYTDDTHRKEAIQLEVDGEKDSLFAYDGVFTQTIVDAFTAAGQTLKTGISYECYRLSRKKFDDTHTYRILTDANRQAGTYPNDASFVSGWGGTWTEIFEMFPSLVEGDYINMYLVVKIDTEVSTDSTNKHQTTIDYPEYTYTSNGTEYTEAAGTEKVTIMDTDDHSRIDEALDSLGIFKYYGRGTNGNFAGGHNKYQLGNDESRDYYVVYERLYEPKLAGASTGGVDYATSPNRFVKQGIGAVNGHHFITRNVDLSGTGMDQFTYEYGGHEIEVHYPTDYFGVLLGDLVMLREQGFPYWLQTQTDLTDDPNATGVPSLDTSETFGEDTQYFSSSSIFEPIFADSNSEYNDVNKAYVIVDGDTAHPMSFKAANEAVDENNLPLYALEGSFPALKVKDGHNGTYTLMFMMEFKEYTQYLIPTTDAEGNVTYEYSTEEPTTGTAGIDYYVIARQIPEYLDVWGYCFTDKRINICDITGATNPLLHMTSPGEESYVDTGSYTYTIASGLSSGTALTESMAFNDAEGLNETTLGAIIGTIETWNTSNPDNLKHMVDLVTGQEINRENLGEFVVDSFCVFVIKYVKDEITYGN